MQMHSIKIQPMRCVQHTKDAAFWLLNSRKISDNKKNDALDIGHTYSTPSPTPILSLCTYPR